jgi:hypothetical protein
VRDHFEGVILASEVTPDLIFDFTMVEKRCHRFKVGKQKTAIPVQISTLSHIDIFVILTSGMVIVVV